MSRKDHRRCLLVPLDNTDLTALRVAARGRSLGNALRRCVESALEHGAQDLGISHDKRARLLPVQLPRTARRQVDDLAQLWGVSAAYVVVQLMASRQGAPDFDPKD